MNLKSSVFISTFLLTLIFLFGIVTNLATGQPLNEPPADNGGEAGDKAKQPQRIMDFRIYGLYMRSSNSAPSVQVTGEQVLAGKFFFYILYNGLNLKTKKNPNEKDQLSIWLTDLGQNSLDYAAVFIIYKHKLLGKESKSCSFPLRRMGKNFCNLTTNYYLAVMVSERIQLHACQQSSDLTDAQGTFACSLAYDDEYSPPSSPTVSLSSCAITRTSNRPWWKAQAPTSFHFEHVELHAAAEFNQWTRNFRVLIEHHECIKVHDGDSFIKKKYDCGGYGNWILVLAEDRDVRLTICGLIAHGSPGGCSEISPPISSAGEVENTNDDNQKCQRILRGHFGMGVRPYPGGLNCQWTLAPTHRSARLMLQFVEFGTAGPQDYVAVYEGKGVRGKLLAKFYGKIGDATAPSKYSKPGVFGAKQYLVSGNISNSLTVQFVTAPVNDTEEAASRNLINHKGFEIKFTAISDDNFLDSGKSSSFNTPVRLCSIDSYAEKLYKLCSRRGKINPVFLYGNVTGGQMLDALVSSNGKLPMPDVNLELMGEKLGIVHLELPEIIEDLTDERVAAFCRAYKKPEVPPRYFDECCCRYCSPSYLSRYCMWDYGTTDRCQLAARRIGAEFSPPSN